LRSDQVNGVDPSDEISFVLELLQSPAVPDSVPCSSASSRVQKMLDQLSCEDSLPSLNPSSTSDKRQKREVEEDCFKKMAEQYECGICYEIMHDPVQVTPCLHAFCAGCLSSWFNKQKDCPSCRKEVSTAAKGFQIKSAIEMLLTAKPEFKRDPSELAKLDDQSMFTRDVYVVEKPVAEPLP